MKLDETTFKNCKKLLHELDKLKKAGERLFDAWNITNDYGNELYSTAYDAMKERAKRVYTEYYNCMHACFDNKTLDEVQKTWDFTNINFLTECYYYSNENKEE